MAKSADNMAFDLYKFDPDATTATDVGFVDMRDYNQFIAKFIRTVGTSAITGFSIVANTASDGSGDEAVITSKAVTTIDAVEDQAYIECSKADIMAAAASAGKAYRYVSAKLAFATGTDEATFGYVRSQPDYAKADLTTDYAAS